MSNHRILQLVSQAQSCGMCACGTTDAEQKALDRHVYSGALVKPYPNCYADREYWHSLLPEKQTMHLIRTLAARHPEWVFAGLSAACVLGYDHRRALHDGRVSIAITRRSSNQHSAAQLGRLYIPPMQLQIVEVNGIRITDPLRTLFDCGRRTSFCDALPMFDAALRSGITAEDLLQYCSKPRRGRRGRRALAVASFADGLSENGGESHGRAAMIIEGFPLPELQREFVDVKTRSRRRADYAWTLSDGSIVIAEFDGSGKYVDPNMTRGRSIMEVVHLERRREQVLEAAGVSAIVRFDWNDVMHPYLLSRKLEEVGVPRGPRRDYLSWPSVSPLH